MIAAAAATTTSVPMSIWPSCASSAAAISAVSRGHRDAHRLDRDQREHRGVADVRRDVDQGREHRLDCSRPAAMAIGIITGLGHVRAAGLQRRRARSRWTRRGARRSSRAGRGPGVDVLHISRHGEGHPRLSNHVTHRANIAALDAARRASGVLAVTVCGAVDPALALGSLVCFDDLHFLVQPAARRRAVHVLHRAGRARARPLDLRGPVLGRAARRAARRRGARRAWPCATAACYGHVDGPRFNTARRDPRARGRGVTAVSQTAGPETVLCGEAELPYALLGYLTDYANGVQDEADAGRDADRDDGRVDRGVRRRPARRACPRAAAAAPAPAGRRLPLRALARDA